MEYRDGAAVLTFRETADGLFLRGSKRSGFSVAGEDRRFRRLRLQSIRTGVGVTVRSFEAVPSPVAVRYGWANFAGSEPGQQRGATLRRLPHRRMAAADRRRFVGGAPTIPVRGIRAPVSRVFKLYFCFWPLFIPEILGVAIFITFNRWNLVNGYPESLRPAIMKKRLCILFFLIGWFPSVYGQRSDNGNTFCC